MWRLNPTLKGGVNEVLCYLNGIVVNHVCAVSSNTSQTDDSENINNRVHRALDQNNS